MKKLIFITLAVFFVSVACNNNSNDTKDNEIHQESVSIENQNTVLLHIEGMTCEGCENTIKAGIESLPGVIEVKASHADSTAIVVYDAEQVNIEEMGKMVQKKGYKYIDSSTVE